MPVNAHPDYLAAEREYLAAQSLEEKIDKLKKMISLSPGHKSAENLRAQLKTRLKKLLEQLEKNKKTSKSGSGASSIKKEDLQCVIIGKTNSGKSSLMKILANNNPKISELSHTTTNPFVGMTEFETARIQLIEIPAIDSEYYDKGIVYTADSVLILAESLEDLNEILEKLKTHGKKIIALTKSDKLSETQKRKIHATLKSKFKQYPSLIISCINPSEDEINNLKQKIFSSFNVLRIYTKEPGKEPDKYHPMILKPGSTVLDVSEKILKGFSAKIKETRIWGPSSKFPGQIVGLKHKLKDLDIVEFKTK